MHHSPPRLRCLSFFFAIACFSLAALAQAPGSSGVEAVLQQGYDLERSGKWLKALQSYEKAAKNYPSSELLKSRIQQCQIHYQIVRRYNDPSFRGKLLTLAQPRALALLDEVMEKVDLYYVDRPDYQTLFETGLNHIMIAIDDPTFRGTNRVEVSADQARSLRESLRKWKGTRVTSRWDMRRYLTGITEQVSRGLSVHPSSVILEFVFGAFGGLDHYSTCLTPNRLTDLYAVIDGNFVGIGVELRSDERGLLVVDVLEGGPAKEAGIKPRDYIVRIGSVPTVGQPLEEAANRLQGREGTSVELWIHTPGEQQARKVVLKRRFVEVRSISKSHIQSPAEGIGYVEISAFQKSTRRELQTAVRSLSKENMRALILDLRGNPGGLLSSAVDISNLFLEQGVIVSTRGRAQGQTHVHRASSLSTWSFPVVVLINKDSASASEIFAGAIQENGRGKVVGTKSYGKGSVQSILPLDTVDAGVRLTTARFYSPRGVGYSLRGVTPDYEVFEPRVDEEVRSIGQLSPIFDTQLAKALQVCRQMLQTASQSSFSER